MAFSPDGDWIDRETDGNGDMRFVVELASSYESGQKMNLAAIQVCEGMGREPRVIGEQVRPPRTALLAFGVPFSRQARSGLPCGVMWPMELEIGMASSRFVQATDRAGRR